MSPISILRTVCASACGLLFNRILCRLMPMIDTNHTNAIWHQFGLMTPEVQSHAELTLMTALEQRQSVPWLHWMTEGVSRPCDHQREWGSLAISSHCSPTTRATMQSDDQCGICQASPAPAPLMTKWLGAIAVWMAAWSWSLWWSAEKRPRARLQNPRMLKPNVSPQTLNCGVEQPMHKSVTSRSSLTPENDDHALSKTMVQERAHGWLKMDKICEGLPLWSFWGIKGCPAGGFSSLCSHSSATCSRRHLPGLNHRIKILISRGSSTHDLGDNLHHFCLFGEVI